MFLYVLSVNGVPYSRSIKITLSAIGIQGFVEHHWIRLQVPKVLRVFWITRLFYQLTLLCVEDYSQRDESQHLLYSLDYYSIVIRLFTQSCENYIAMLGMTSVVSYFAHHVGVFLAFCVGSIHLSLSHDVPFMFSSVK